MSDSDTVIDLSSAAVIIPALDEAENLALLLPQLPLLRLSAHHALHGEQRGQGQR